MRSAGSFNRDRAHMKLKLLLSCILITGLASPAFARKYYVVQNTKTLRCSVLPKKPKGKTVTVLSGSTSFATRAEARTAMRAASACKGHAQERP
jgi:hypothetical protein